MGITIAQELIEKGIKIGEEIGIKIGEGKGRDLLKKNLLRSGRNHLGEPDSTILQKLQSISDLDQLDLLCEQAYRVQSWTELLEAR